MAKSKNLQEIRSKIIAKAWKDPVFKKKLLSNPTSALKEMGVDLPPNATVKVVEDSSQTFTFVLPASPANITMLSDENLENVAGGCPKGCPSGYVSGN